MSASSSALHTILEKFAADAKNVCSEMRARACSELAGRLNQAVRRIRQAATREELGETVADTAAAFATGAAWFRIEDGAARSERLALTIPLAEAPALTGAVETREPVIALASGAEVSPQLVERFTHTAESRSFVYPILAAEKTPALLYAWADPQHAGPGANHAGQTSALELLAQVASAAWLALEPPPPPPAPLITIASVAKPANPWEALGVEEQQIHLRAQRYARVQVAEMRLRSAAAVQSGRLRRNLYHSLRDPIDAARDAFRKEFFAKCPSMVDYLHLELMRTLANDDADLLGKEYPGPMV
ncbi:MAG: hypothetical protein WBY44_03965 [Bryobacteraceae bacterium]